MYKFLIGLSIIPFSLSGMNKTIPDKIIPILVGSRLHYNLAYYQRCQTMGIPAKENEPFINIAVDLGPQMYSDFLCLPLSILLDEKNNIIKNTDGTMIHSNGGYKLTTNN